MIYSRGKIPLTISVFRTEQISGWTFLSLCFACGDEFQDGSFPRLSVEMGLVAVFATRLWHHQFMGDGLAEIAEWSGDEGPSLTRQTNEPPTLP